MTDLSSVPLFLTTKQFAELTGCSEASVRRGIKEGRIPADKPNGRWMICRDVVFSSAREVFSRG